VSDVKRVPGWIAAAVIVASVVAGCGGGDSGLTIDEPAFAASSACDGEGTYEVTMEGGSPSARAIGDVENLMISDGLPSVWCHGLRHQFVGSVVIGGYVFGSDADDPLEFVVDREEGFHYVAGTGTVEKPDGDVVTLP
jgi:hypothetical protein